MQKHSEMVQPDQGFRAKCAACIRFVRKQEQTYEQTMHEVYQVCPTYGMFPAGEMGYSLWLW